MSKFFKITKLTYDEATDTLSARAFLHEDLNDFVMFDSELAAEVVVEIEHSFSNRASITVERSKDNVNAPAILAAFAEQFQSAHDEQNPGDSPALTTLDVFCV